MEAEGLPSDAENKLFKLSYPHSTALQALLLDQTLKNQWTGGSLNTDRTATPIGPLQQTNGEG